MYPSYRCVGVGSEYSQGLNNSGTPDISTQNPLPSLIWPKVPEKGHGVKSGIWCMQLI